MHVILSVMHRPGVYSALVNITEMAFVSTKMMKKTSTTAPPGDAEDTLLF